MIETSPDRSGEVHAGRGALALGALTRAKVPFLVGGAFALTQYTGVVRSTKDLDLFVREADLARALDVLESIGFAISVPFPHWLAKAKCEALQLDIIFGFGNGLARVDDEWLEHARDAELYRVPVRLVPAEELLWSKAFVMERERYDGADVAHLIHAQAHALDWNRLRRRFGPNHLVLLSHLALYLFIYSDASHRLPHRLYLDLLDAARAELAPPPSRDLAVDALRRASTKGSEVGPDGPRVCRGTLLSRQQYLVDIESRGYADARIVDRLMTDEELAIWTAAIESEQMPCRD